MNNLQKLTLAVYKLRDHTYRVLTTDGTIPVDRSVYYELLLVLKEIEAEQGIDSTLLGYKERLELYGQA